MTLLPLAFATALCAMATPAAAQVQASSETDPNLAPPESAQIANEGAIRNRWALDGELALPAWPDGFAQARRDVCLALGYTINPDGSTSNFHVLQQWNSDTGGIEPADGFWAAFAGAGVDAVRQWKFTPRPEAGAPQPVFTVATLTWKTRADTWPNALRGRCDIDNLAAFLHRYQERYDLNDHLFDRAQRRNEDRHQAIAGTPY
ncbi:energy transducer TonB [Lysobacter sp. A6]|uniref:Energy transducer TonB n=1 Tax=Noviluteimonas lactosilytica TaxID=2888523 RepID=A0ABS8JKI8_9GAMM|nr:energy transducer TonB [Lysobacter lactosilyticus]MCC8364129.1 energy transducer TonB [Lysobacter lactosilyticus]